MEGMLYLPVLRRDCVPSTKVLEVLGGVPCVLEVLEGMRRSYTGGCENSALCAVSIAGDTLCAEGAGGCSVGVAGCAAEGAGGCAEGSGGYAAGVGGCAAGAGGCAEGAGGCALCAGGSEWCAMRAMDAGGHALHAVLYSEGRDGELRLLEVLE